MQKKSRSALPLRGGSGVVTCIVLRPFVCRVPLSPATGCPNAVRSHPEKAIDCGLNMIAQIQGIATKEERALAVRVGISTGSVVAGVVGGAGRTYDLWGDAVNMASQMESKGHPGRVHISAFTHEALTRASQYIFHSHEVCGKDQATLKTFFVEKKLTTTEQWKF